MYIYIYIYIYRGGYLDNFCNFRPEYFDCLPFKIVSYELFRCGKMISEAVRIFYVLIIKKWIFAAGGYARGTRKCSYFI